MLDNLSELSPEDRSLRKAALLRTEPAKFKMERPRFPASKDCFRTRYQAESAFVYYMSHCPYLCQNVDTAKSRLATLHRKLEAVMSQSSEARDWALTTSCLDAAAGQSQEA